jgi:hypothetical protein
MLNGNCEGCLLFNGNCEGCLLFMVTVRVACCLMVTVRVACCLMVTVRVACCLMVTVRVACCLMVTVRVACCLMVTVRVACCLMITVRVACYFLSLLNSLFLCLFLSFRLWRQFVRIRFFAEWTMSIQPYKSTRTSMRKVPGLCIVSYTVYHEFPRGVLQSLQANN